MVSTRHSQWNLAAYCVFHSTERQIKFHVSLSLIRSTRLFIFTIGDYSNFSRRLGYYSQYTVVYFTELHTDHTDLKDTHSHQLSRLLLAVCTLWVMKWINMLAFYTTATKIRTMHRVQSYIISLSGYATRSVVLSKHTLFV
jgi:hypothetical protein